LWQRGGAGIEVPLTLLRNGQVREVVVHSVDRNALLKKPRLQ
jgi:hypothetical protein